MSAQKKLSTFFSRYAVVIIFVIITLIAIPPSGLSIKYILQEIITRLGRNSFLVLALLLPIYAGMGLNFGMTLGAMAGQVGLIFAVNYGISNWQGLVFALLVGLPISVLLGYVCGLVMNRAKGREMVTGYILAFFINGIYQFFVMYMLGSVIPMGNKSIVLSRGYGIRNTLNLESVRQSLDNIVMLRVGGFSIPLVSFIVIALLCVFVVWFKKTKLGQDMRAVGQDMAVAEAAGIPVEKTRIVAIIISTVLACAGQIIFLQNMGNLATYNAHDQTGFFAVAAILVGGASVTHASIANVFLGVTLLHAMFVVSPLAGQKLFGSAMIGEYFRQFIGYGVIAISLVLYAWRTRKAAAEARLSLRGAQNGPGKGNGGTAVGNGGQA
ncbi:MAG: ABC transporter permease [Rectinema sp.]|uniref:ABC-type transporter, integral membrane subunit n=1 Tax=uncultured spirochete TaxID=156406 RepID=A0A3P3XPB8_9SPIR|nr:ABC-type transporter, integral membrane subunit [uncultured spirochete]